MKASGVIFDLDGTLVDNMALHAEAFSIFVARHGLSPLTEQDRARLDGKRNRDIFPDVFGRSLEETFLQACIHEKESLYRDLSRGRLVPLAGLLPLLDALDAAGVPVGIATSAPAENVKHSLAELGLSGRLTRIVRSDEVARGKPAPDVFLATARLLGVAPESCLAFEDAPAGLVSARAAGMACVAVTTSFDAEALSRHGASFDLTVRDFEEFLPLTATWIEDAAATPAAR